MATTKKRRQRSMSRRRRVSKMLEGSTFEAISFEEIVIVDSINARCFTSDEKALARPGASIEELAQSIDSVGLIEPLIVRETEDGYVLICGSRRWRAIEKLRAKGSKAFEKVPCRVLQGAVITSDDLLLNLEENWGREDLTVYEIGRRCCELKRDFAMTDAEIAARTGRARSFVSSAMAVCENLHPTILERMQKGAEISDPRLFSARNLFKWAKLEPAKQLRAFQDAIEWQTRKRPTRKTEPKAAPPPEPEAAKLLLALERRARADPKTWIFALQTAQFLLGVRKTPPVSLRK